MKWLRVFKSWIKKLFNKPKVDNNPIPYPNKYPLPDNHNDQGQAGKKFIDISHWVDIDFYRLEFDDVIMKATEGSNYIDEKLYSNVDGCKKNNKRFGFYHYYRIDNDPIIQATHFIKAVGADLFKSCYHLPVIDLELGGNHSEKSIKRSLGKVKKFAEYIEKETDRKCRIYSNDALMRYLADEFKRLDFDKLCENPWVARYPNTPKYFSPWPKLWAHQYTETAIIKGSHNKVDLNRFM